VNETEAKQAVAIALAACPQHALKISLDEVRLMVKAWTMLLEDLSSSEVMAALKRYLATNKWLPAPADIRAIAAEAKHGRQRPGSDAWEDVRKAIGTVGSYRLPTFVDPLVARAVAALGWRELCASENPTADRARFVELYQQYARAAAEDAVVGALPGVSRPALPAVGQANELVASLAAQLGKGAA
jgi:hypothetical protein